ncbi:MAG: nucleotide exchange factor GrpE [Coriobacteriaceae bacterium]|nr:nucleotide exchange factor GrpE [Coriobacteriaceae bacterium]
MAVEENMNAEETAEELEAQVVGEADSEEGQPQAEAPGADEDPLAKALAEVEDWKGRFMRLHAEWDTYRRRTEEQRAEDKARAGENLVTGLIPVLDDFERSIDYAVNNGEVGLLDGVKQVYSKLVGVLEKGGVVVIDPAGEPFDALEHQAVANVDRSDVYDETVEQVYQKGYKMGRKVIRPAMVTVATGGPKRPVEDAAEEEK